MVNDEVEEEEVEDDEVEDDHVMHRVGDDVGNHVDRSHGLHPHFAGRFAREKNLPKLRTRKL